MSVQKVNDLFETHLKQFLPPFEEEGASGASAGNS